jgi:hypothetical protein
MKKLFYYVVLYSKKCLKSCIFLEYSSSLYSCTHLTSSYDRHFVINDYKKLKVGA